MKQQQRKLKQSKQRHGPVLHMVHTVRGLAPRIAEVCGINREAVWNWHQVPAKHVLNIEELLKIPRHLIRPDIYPPPYHRLIKRTASQQNGRKQNGGKAA